MAYKAYRDVQATFLEAKDLVTSASPITFYYIKMPNVATPLAYTDYPGSSSVTYFKPNSTNSQNYLPAPVAHSQISNNTQGEINRVELTLSNVDRTIGGYLHSYDALRNSDVSIIEAFQGHLDDPYANITNTYYIDGAVLGEKQAKFDCAPKFSINKVTVPFRKYIKDQCQWQFKDSDTCKYSGNANTCGKTLASCTSYDNTINFGGFPGIPSRRVIR